MSTKTSLVTLPEQIRRARLLKTMTTYDLAEAAGVSRTTIYHYEKGEHVASVRAIRAIAKALGVEPQDLVRVA